MDLGPAPFKCRECVRRAADQDLAQPPRPEAVSLLLSLFPLMVRGLFKTDHFFFYQLIID